MPTRDPVLTFTVPDVPPDPPEVPIEKLPDAVFDPLMEKLEPPLPPLPPID
jgi:hypothetical protein